MNRKELKQYLELLNCSGIDSLVKIDNDSEKKNSLNTNIPETETVLINDDTANTHNPADGMNKVSLFKELQQKYKDCTKCELQDNRIQFVYGDGDVNAKLMLIGEGPGSEENKQGKPFVGRAGQLLTKMLAAINLNREDVYIANVVKCQPPANRNPLPDEVSQCLPYLWEQIELINPKLIVLLGKVAASALLGENDTLGNMRTKQYWLNTASRTIETVNDNHNEYSIETYVSYHPAALLRNPAFKKGSWVDLQKYRDILNLKPVN